jgi:hypothetical protein
MTEMPRWPLAADDNRERAQPRTQRGTRYGSMTDLICYQRATVSVYAERGSTPFKGHNIVPRRTTAATLK